MKTVIGKRFSLNNKYREMIFWFGFVFLFIVGSIYTVFIWNERVRETEASAIRLAEAANSLMPTEMLKQLSGNINDLQKR
ncbi:MAG: hypothetical protein VB012_03690 [Erysipelotrichaceae bacterium]|nr:hypothetical protein [Erysipelotrichaceae bacterium]